MKANHNLIHHFLEQSARLYPNKIALIHDDIRATYSEINTKANQLAHYLIDRGLQPGDRVALLLENSLEYVVSYYGILKAGAVAAALSTGTKPDGLKYYLGHLEPKVLISSKKFERVLKATGLADFDIQSVVLKAPKMNWSSHPFPVFSWDDIIRGDLTAPPQLTINDSQLLSVNRKIGCSHEGDSESEMNGFLQGQGSQEAQRRRTNSTSHKEPRRLTQRLLERNISERDLAAIVYTSGSTGKPKGVMLSHRNIASNTHSICQYMHLTEKDIQMVVLPFFYVMGKSLLNTHFAVGGTVVINNKFAFPAAMINQMVEEKVTGFSGVPSTYAYLLYRSPLAKLRAKLGSLRYCSQAGGHMSTKIKQELRKVLPEHTEFYIMYGATEASARLTYLEPEAFHRKMDSIGKPIPGVGMRVTGPDGEELPTGQTGELVGHGPNVMLGYWGDEEASSKVLDKDGYHTGDIGYQDEDGYFYVIGRGDNLLKVGGHRINPREIEEALMDTGLVIEVAVLCVPDIILGNKLVALACTKNGDCNENMILRQCVSKLPSYKLPSKMKLVRSLPKNSNGKIDLAKCLQLASEPREIGLRRA